MLNYPALFSPDEHGGYVVTFRDVPEALTQTDTLPQAREMAANALATAMEFYLENKRPAPVTSRAQPGEEMVCLSAARCREFAHMLHEAQEKKHE